LGSQSPQIFKQTMAPGLVDAVFLELEETLQEVQRHSELLSHLVLDLLNHWIIHHET
jgi:hypothetical protein